MATLLISIATGQATVEPLWIKAVPIAVSVVALLVALTSASLTAYFQYFKKPHLSIVLDAHMDAWRSPEMQLIFSIPVVLANDGARYGIVHRIGGTITMADGYVSSFAWRMFTETKALGDEGREFKPWGAFAGLAETLVIPSRAAVTKRVQFISRLAVIVVPGTYRIDFEVFSSSGERPAARASVKYVVTTDTEAGLIACVVNPSTGVVDRSVRIPLARA